MRKPPHNEIAFFPDLPLRVARESPFFQLHGVKKQLDQNPVKKPYVEEIAFYRHIFEMCRFDKHENQNTIKNVTGPNKPLTPYRRMEMPLKILLDSSEEKIQSRGCAVEVCGPHTGHTVAPIAFCENEYIAQQIVSALRFLRTELAKTPA